MAVSPLLFALVAMLSWGVWTAMANLATETINPTVAMTLSYISSVLVALGYVGVTQRDVTLTGEGVGWALVSGVFAGIGAMAFYTGLKRGQVGIVTSVSALYFVVAALIGVTVLGETLGVREIAGIGFAVLAVVLLAG